MKRCAQCALRYPSDDEIFCARCGGRLFTPDFFERNRRAITIAVIAGMCAVMIAIGQSEEDNPHSRPKYSATPQDRRVSTAAALSSFRNKLMSLPQSNALILSVEGSSVEGVARVQVSNLWYNSRPHERRQLTQMLANLWTAEMKGAPAILHIYDITGREIAGTRAFGGIWTEDDE